MESTRALPTGVVTFLLTDIEGSTRRWESEPEAMREALERHDAIVNAYVRRLNGHVVKSKGEGDSVFAVFSHARDAVMAALVLQCAIGDEQWVTSTPIRVRMAIHTGKVELRHDDYYGQTVNRCARLRALATGGQVLVSGVTEQLTRGQLPKGASMVDLGSHQLKDLSAPERVWELTHPRMMGDNHASRASPGSLTASTPRAYVLTDHTNQDAEHRFWGERIKHTSEEGIRCYVTPATAALLNAVVDGFRLPRLWEAVVDREPVDSSATLMCQEVTTQRHVSLPNAAGLQHARFAVLCARAAYDEGRFAEEFHDWAASWLAGEDSSGSNARDLAEALEREARPDPDSGLTLPHALMLANAAWAASHAAKLPWLVGRGRDEANSRAIQCAVEAEHTALRMARLDLITLAELAMPRPASPLTPLRSPVPMRAKRILKPLPT